MEMNEVKRMKSLKMEQKWNRKSSPKWKQIRFANELKKIHDNIWTIPFFLFTFKFKFHFHDEADFTKCIFICVLLRFMIF